MSAIAAAATNVLQATNNGECSTNTSVFNPIGMDTSNCVASSSSSVGSQNQQQDEAQINSIDTGYYYFFSKFNFYLRFIFLIHLKLNLPYLL